MTIFWQACFDVSYIGFGADIIEFFGMTVVAIDKMGQLAIFLKPINIVNGRLIEAWVMKFW